MIVLSQVNLFQNFDTLFNALQSLLFKCGHKVKQ